MWNLWLLSLESGEMQRLTSYRHGQTWGASWFPGGERIIYTHEATIVVRDLLTGVTREFNSPIPKRLVRTAAVSPDGSRVIFQVYRDGVWILALGDGSMQRVLADPSAEEFSLGARRHASRLSQPARGPLGCSGCRVPGVRGSAASAGLFSVPRLARS